jgi:hypothetical protein
MGNKAGYAEVILAALGFRSGQGAERYLWAEADDDVAAMLRCYPDASMLRRVAEIIRGWKDEEPRALWERLRAERKARAGAEGVARYVQLATSNRLIPGAFAADGRWVNSARDGGSHTDGGVSFGGPDFATPAETNADACHRLAEYATIVSGNRLVNMAGPALMNTGNGGTRHGGEFATPVEDVATAFERVAGEVAAHAWMVPRSWKGEPAAGFRAAHPADPTPDSHGGANYQPDAPAPGLCDLASRRGWPPVHVLPHIPTADEIAALLGTPGDLEGVVVYSDPDYRDTTGYASTCRDMIPERARGWDAYGAVVCISEAVPIPELPTWFTAEITAGRKGQKRTFSKQQGEWLTMNREPAHRVAVQAGLFAVGA